MHHLLGSTLIAITTIIVKQGADVDGASVNDAILQRLSQNCQIYVKVASGGRSFPRPKELLQSLETPYVVSSDDNKMSTRGCVFPLYFWTRENSTTMAEAMSTASTTFGIGVAWSNDGNNSASIEKALSAGSKYGKPLHIFKSTEGMQYAYECSLSSPLIVKAFYKITTLKSYGVTRGERRPSGRLGSPIFK